jgi:hypothetical protein
MRTIRPATLLLLFVVAILLAACAGSAASMAPGGAVFDEGQAAPSGAPAAPESVSGGGAVVDDGSGTVGGDGVGAPIDDARIVRTGSIDLEVSDVGASLTRARDGIRALGGYIGASTTQNQDDRPIASVTYRIPAERWEDALDLLRGIDSAGTKVVAEQTDAVEVTGQVIDLEARIKNLQASEAALQEIAAKAVRIPDILEVQNQLTQVRGQIESLTAQLVDLEDRSAYATLTARFQLPVVAVEIAKENWEPAQVVDEASASLVSVLQALTTAGIWFAIVWLPIILVIGIVIAVAMVVMRRLGVIRPRGPKSGEAVAG